MYEVIKIVTRQATRRSLCFYGYGVSTLASFVLMAGVRSLDSVNPRRELIPQTCFDIVTEFYKYDCSLKTTL